MSPPVGSNVWNYFEPNTEDQDKADCKICNKSYSRKGRTTSSLKSHLKSMHPEVFSIYDSMSKEIKLQKIKSDTEQHSKDDWVINIPALQDEQRSSSAEDMRGNAEEILFIPLNNDNDNITESKSTSVNRKTLRAQNSGHKFKTRADLKYPRARTTTKFDKLRCAQLQLVELQMSIARKEHEYKREEHNMKMRSLENDEARKREIHEILLKTMQ